MAARAGKAGAGMPGAGGQAAIGRRFRNSDHRQGVSLLSAMILGRIIAAPTETGAQQRFPDTK